ncbi:MAG: hypothetical protein AAGF68_10610 [Pseudomonadota bacterium]
MLDLDLYGLQLAEHASQPKRKLVGDASYHDAAFRSQYDYRTLFYDCFADELTGDVALLGPPLLNLEALIRDADLKVDGRPVAIKSIAHLSRCSVTRLDCSAGQLLSVRHPLFSGVVPIGTSFVQRLSGLNAIYTISRNNRLEWIADWLRYYVEVHGAEAVILSDNGSTDYPPEALRQTLAGIAGLRVAVILRAPYPFGPRAANSAGYRALFLQRSLAELARIRFLAQARAVVNADIDELFHSHRGRSIFDATVQSQEGYVRANAVWVYAAAPPQGEAYRHAEHSHVSLSGSPKANRKWCVAPQGPMQGKQWLTHFINDRRDPVDPDFVLWHFRQITTGWKYDRALPEIELVRDEGLVKTMQRVFARASGARSHA